MVCLATVGCVQQPPKITPADAAAQVQTGRALLTCRDACLAEWRRLQPQAAQYDAAARWPELAATVLEARYEDDLSLYYLGRAAEGLGFPGAAASYYRQSQRFSGTSASCQNLSRNCGGIDPPRAASARLASIERQINAPMRRRAIPAPRPGAPPEPTVETPGPIGTAPPWEPPAATPAMAASPAPPAEAAPATIFPPAMAAPAPAPSPAPARAPTATEFIEPPPAR